MDIAEHPIYREVLNIVNSGMKPVRYAVTATIHTIDNRNRVPVLRVLSFDEGKDFVKDYAPVVFIKLKMGAGTFATAVYPFINNIEITVTMTPMGELNAGTNFAEKVIQRTYKAVLVDKGNPNLQQDSSAPLTNIEMDLSNLIDVDFQLMSKSAEAIKNAQIGTIVRQETVEKTLITLLSTEFAKLAKTESDAIRYVNMVPASNKALQEQIIISAGTSLPNLPLYMQLKGGGVYNAGIGYFVQDDAYYIFPLFDTTRYGQTPESITIINIPKNKIPHTERTYRQNGSNLVIIATGDIKFKNVAQEKQTNLGTGIRFTDADALISGVGETKDNQTTLSRNTINNEFVVTKRTDELNYAPAKARNIHANPFIELSALAQRNGSIVMLEWQNSNINLIKPGTPIRLVYMEGHQLKSLKGTILKVHEYTQLLGENILETTLGKNASIVLFIENVHQLN